MSVNLLLDDPEKPTIWRGPIINNLIRQLFLDVNWGELHYLIVDLPPGTSDAPLTVFQSLPLSGVVTVTTPQDLARLIVTKSANMAKMLKVPLIGLVENMSYFECGHCNKKTSLLGPSHGKESAEYLETELLGKVGVDPKISILSDNGQIEKYESVTNQLSDCETYEKFMRQIGYCGYHINRVLKPGAFCVWVVGDWRCPKGGGLRSFHSDLISLFTKEKLIHHDTIIMKNISPFAPLQACKVASKRYTSKIHEYVMVFLKEGEYEVPDYCSLDDLRVQSNKFFDFNE